MGQIWPKAALRVRKVGECFAPFIWSLIGIFLDLPEILLGRLVVLLGALGAKSAITDLF